MVSSLAAQLSQGVSLNAPLLADRSRRKRTESYLFSSREADQHDVDSIYALGFTALSKLKTLDVKFARYDETIFSQAARGLDRTLQSVSQNAELDQALGAFLKDLGPYLLEAPASKALEWLVRRFRVNEFNLDDVLALFLPYHDTPHFAKMVSIMHIEKSELWSFLAPTKAAGKPLPRSVLVDEMVKSIELARFVISLLPESLRESRTFRTLVGFTAGVTLDYLTRMKAVKEDILAFVLPAVTRCFAGDSNADCALAGYITLATLSQRCRFSSEALLVIVTEMIKGQRHIQPQQLLPLLVAVIGPQDELDSFSNSFTDSIIKLPGLAAALSDCLQWAGAEKLVLPLLSGLVNSVSEKQSFDTLESILRSPVTSNAIVERYTLLCVEKVLSGETDPAFTRSLSVAYQRKDTTFSDVYARRMKKENSQGQEVLEIFLRSVTLPPSSSDDRGGWIVSTHAADENDRVMAVKEILKALAAGDTGSDLYEALLARIADTSLKVAEALYSDTRAVLPVFSNAQFVETVSDALPNFVRAAMRLHIAFITEDLYGANMDLAPIIFQRICLPYILFTKPRHKSAAMFWQTLKGTKFAEYELLAGCMDIVVARSKPEGTEQEDLRPPEELMALNLTLVHKIAGNIVTSNSYHLYLDRLLGLLKSSDVQAINVAYLLLRSLLKQLSGEHQVDAAYRILTAMGMQPLNALEDQFYESNLENYISEDALSRNIVSKPSSRGTTRRLQAAILALLPTMQRPVGIKIDWLGHSSPGSDTRGKRFVELARALYTLANKSSAAQKLSANILRALFVNLREDTLLFLAGIWSTGSQSEHDTEHLRLVALLHGTAFLKAQFADLGHSQDFQVILPSLLIAVQSRERSIRIAAVDCIALLAQNPIPTTTSPSIYALDSAYGIGSDGLQYLEQGDFARYTTSLHSYRDHFINDSKYLGIFEQEMLYKNRSDNKKETGYKYRVLCYTLSHVLVWTSLEARVALLSVLRHVTDAAKMQMLLPLVQEVVSDDSSNPPQDKQPTSVWGAYCRALFEVYDETTATDLNEPGSRAWTTLERTLHFMFSDCAHASIRETVVMQLCGGLFNLLTLERQLEICVILIDVAAVQADYNKIIKETLGTFSKNAALMTLLLAHFQPKETNSSQRAAKRVKTAIDMDDSSEISLRPLTVLVETILANPLPGSVELMSCAIEVLTRVFHAYSSKSDANYLMQLLMVMLESLASSLAGNTTLPPGSIRMEILVELLRVSENPQTFNQALLLMASLARLSPEFVMQNVMPVFTFMGSNVFHRDDSYSFRVVQKTVESIVPVMISTLKAKHSAPLDLQIASREFLRVFTDAATHVPRHRRTQFFNHLVEVLGPDEFTVPICLLLVDKAANRVVRQKPGDVANALGLPLIVLQANFKATPFKVVEQLLNETTRLLLRITEPEGAAQDAFLESHVDAEHTASTSAKKQIQAILVFVDLVLQQCSRKAITSDEGAVQGSVRILLELSDLGRGSASFPDSPDISRTALKTLGHLLRVISVAEFISSISTIISSKNPAIESGAMNLLSSRLMNVAPKTRQEISPIITSITEHLCGSLKKSQDLPTLKADLKALSSISKAAVNTEMQGLNKAVPVVLQVATNQKNLTAEVLACILPLSAAIGPRILPCFRGVVELCCEVLAQVDANDQQNRGGEDAQSVLVALMSSLSQFWGNDELVRLTVLTLNTRPTSILLRTTLAKRIPAKQLLPALFHVWSDVATLDLENAESLSRQGTFFDLLKRVIRGSPREDIHEQLRQIFKLFLEAFDTVGKQEDSEDSKNALLAAFVEVVTKLNEAAFKPLFRRLFDWAFNDNSDTSQWRQVTFCRVLTALIKLFKGLVTPYMGIVLVPLTERLESYCTDHSQSPRLWASAVELFQCSVDLDEGAFWRIDKLRKLTPTLIAQIDVCPSFGVDSTRLVLKTCLNTLAAAVDDDSLLKALNLQILMKTRSDDAKVRVFALECAGHVWHGSGGKLIGFVSDVVTFIAECADDQHDDVAKEARKLKKIVESRCGSLDALM